MWYYPAAPAFVQVFGVILGWYLLSASVFMHVVLYLWKKSEKPEYLELIDKLEDDRSSAIRFGLTWPLTFTFMLLTYYSGNGISFKERFLDAAADHANETLDQRKSK